MAKRGFSEAYHLAVMKMVVARLGAFARTGTIAKSGKTRDGRWALNSN